MTPLLDTRIYRDNAYAPSRELAGPTIQVLQQRASLMENYAALAVHSSQRFKSWCPKGLLLIGSLERDCKTDVHTQSFELYRQSVSNMEIVTYDELRTRIHNLLGLLGSSQE